MLIERHCVIAGMFVWGARVVDLWAVCSRLGVGRSLLVAVGWVGLVDTAVLVVLVFAGGVVNVLIVTGRIGRLGGYSDGVCSVPWVTQTVVVHICVDMAMGSVRVPDGGSPCFVIRLLERF
jgi:hypothetical protein